MEYNVNNISTIAALIAGFITPLLVKYLGLNINQTTIASVIVLIILYISSRNPNTIKALGNALSTTKEKCDEVSEALDDVSEAVTELETVTDEDVDEAVDDVVENVVEEVTDSEEDTA